jgi:2-hydroxy-6-oxonona-2,4-dienedioate hydrolase
MSEDRGASYQSVWKHMMTVPFRQDYVMADGLRTRYVQAGSPMSPALLLLHGTGGHWETFCANLGALSEHFNCYAVDMMGCGFTDKPDKPYEIKDYVTHLVAFMNEAGLTSASIVGVSLGAWVATRMALAHPDRVDKMILISPPGLLPLRAASGSTIANRRASAADPSWENISKVLSNLVYDKTTLMDDMVAVRQRVYSLPGIEQIMPRMLTLFDPDIRARNNLSEAEWRSLRMPVLVIAHVDSPDLYLETADKIMELLPTARRVNMRKTAHWSHFEDPETFNRLAIEFLQQKNAAAA